MNKDTKNLKPLYIPREGNWNYFLDPTFFNTVFCIAKPGTDCKSSMFGNVQYFTNWLRRELEKDPTIDGRFTALCFGLLDEAQGKAARV